METVPVPSASENPPTNRKYVPGSAVYENRERKPTPSSSSQTTSESVPYSHADFSAIAVSIFD
eukprot:2309173-Rhodomonas_salina.1